MLRYCTTKKTMSCHCGGTGDVNVHTADVMAAVRAEILQRGEDERVHAVILRSR